MRRIAWIVGLAGSLVSGLYADEHAYLPLYRDYPVGAWDDWSWASRNMQNTSPVYSGQYSIRVDLYPWSAVRFHHGSGLDPTGFTLLEFWVHGGSTGGQVFHIMAKVNDVDQTPVPITNYATVRANQWTRVQIPLRVLGISAGQRVDDIYFIERRGQSVPTFYLDEIRLVRPYSTSVTFAVNAASTGRTLTRLHFGMNVATWDWNLTNSTTLARLRQIRSGLLRFPGGSTSDEYDWSTNRNKRTGETYGTNTSQFISVASQVGAEKFITVNYGSGTPEEARDWVQYANRTLNGNVRYWAIGNECYGLWEYDTHLFPHDAHTYANFVRDAINLMKAVDPTIKIGVAGTWSETDYPQRFFVTNPRTGQTVNGWSAVLLQRLASMSVVPDFYEIHYYPQNPGREDDAYLLYSTREWSTIVSSARQMLRDYLGTAGDSVMLFAMENNAISTTPGKQTTSLVNALYYAESWGQALLAGIDAFAWWDLHNSAEARNNNSPLLYGWRNVGDYGVLASGYPSDTSEPLNTPYPVFYACELVSRFAQPGDTLVQVSGSHPLVSVYAVRTSNGRVNLLILNKARTTPITARIAFSGYRLPSTATLVWYGPDHDAGKKPPSSRILRLRSRDLTLKLEPLTLYVVQL